ncbi:hypothetical protein NVP1170O_147 [Vibrio phage 1.170.O._10N.261.52.C3]|nr:hypothetical protein NVP1170O_147 [Vibrio phage 1.170.O._10N.261.52.C3]
MSLSDDFYLDNPEMSKCAVTKELVIQIANLHPSTFIKKGEIDIYDVLYYLGFDVKQNMRKKDINIKRDVVVRHPDRKYETYVTDVYEGTIRKEIDYVENRVIHYSNKPHHLQGMYMLHGLLHAVGLDDIIKEFTNVQEVGDPNYVYGQ